ncbi:MAG: hypothetical protein Q7R83_02845 [bacterium]|nr:hypothetical protein [bacterium]
MEKPPSRLSSLFGKKDKSPKDKPTSKRAIAAPAEAAVITDVAFVEAKRLAQKQLIEQAEQIMQEADQNSAVPLGMSMLLQAERVMDKLEKVQAAKTQESLEKVLEEKTMDFNEVAKEQSKLLKARRGLEIDFHPISPEITEEQLAVFHEIFGTGNLEPLILPTADQFTEAYQNAMYPATETEDDKEKGIINHHPSYWNQAAGETYQTTEGETWGSVFIRSMKAHLKTVQDSQGVNPVLFQESIIKPKYVSGGSLYGSKDSATPGLDALLPLIQEVFGKDDNRFNHSNDDLTQQFVPKIIQKIEQRLQEKGLPIPNFKIILAPSVSSNLQTVLYHPESSTTNTREWASDTLLAKDGKDSGHRLNVGNADYGGAGRVGSVARGSRLGDGGFRLAVVLTP